MSVQETTPKFPAAGAAFLEKMNELDDLQKGAEGKVRARLNRLRRARDPRIAVAPAAVAKPPLSTATRFKGAKRVGSMIAEAVSVEVADDPIDVAAARRGLSVGDYVDARTARHRLAEDAQRRDERERGLCWTFALVERCVIEAFEVILRTPTDRGPREFGNAMPPYVREFEDAVGVEETQARSRTEIIRQLGPPTMEESERMWLIWAAMRTLPALLHVGLTWSMRCEVYGVRHSEAQRATGILVADMVELRDQAIEALVARLTETRAT